MTETSCPCRCSSRSWRQAATERRETWTTAQLAAHQRRSVRALRDHARATSMFYQQFHHGLDEGPLCDLPVLTNAMLVERFDDIVTNPDVHLPETRGFLTGMRPGELYRGHHCAAATGGTTGRSGVGWWDLATASP